MPPVLNIFSGLLLPGFEGLPFANLQGEVATDVLTSQPQPQTGDHADSAQQDTSTQHHTGWTQAELHDCAKRALQTQTCRLMGKAPQVLAKIKQEKTETENPLHDSRTASLVYLPKTRAQQSKTHECTTSGTENNTNGSPSRNKKTTLFSADSFQHRTLKQDTWHELKLSGNLVLMFCYDHRQKLYFVQLGYVDLTTGQSQNQQCMLPFAQLQINSHMYLWKGMGAFQDWVIGINSDGSGFIEKPLCPQDDISLLVANRIEQTTSNKPGSNLSTHDIEILSKFNVISKMSFGNILTEGRQTAETIPETDKAHYTLLLLSASRGSEKTGVIEFPVNTFHKYTQHHIAHYVTGARGFFISSIHDTQNNQSALCIGRDEVLHRLSFDLTQSKHPDWICWTGKDDFKGWTIIINTTTGAAIISHSHILTGQAQDIVSILLSLQGATRSPDFFSESLELNAALQKTPLFSLMFSLQPAESSLELPHHLARKAEIYFNTTTQKPRTNSLNLWAISSDLAGNSQKTSMTIPLSDRLAFHTEVSGTSQTQKLMLIDNLGNHTTLGFKHILSPFNHLLVFRGYDDFANWLIVCDTLTGECYIRYPDMAVQPSAKTPAQTLIRLLRVKKITDNMPYTETTRNILFSSRPAIFATQTGPTNTTAEENDEIQKNTGNNQDPPPVQKTTVHHFTQPSLRLRCFEFDSHNSKYHKDEKQGTHFITCVMKATQYSIMFKWDDTEKKLYLQIENLATQTERIIPFTIEKQDNMPFHLIALKNSKYPETTIIIDLQTKTVRVITPHVESLDLNNPSIFSLLSFVNTPKHVYEVTDPVVAQILEQQSITLKSPLLPELKPGDQFVRPRKIQLPLEKTDGEQEITERFLMVYQRKSGADYLVITCINSRLGGIMPLGLTQNTKPEQGNLFTPVLPWGEDDFWSFGKITDPAQNTVVISGKGKPVEQLFPSELVAKEAEPGTLRKVTLKKTEEEIIETGSTVITYTDEDVILKVMLNTAGKPFYAELGRLYARQGQKFYQTLGLFFSCSNTVTQTPVLTGMGNIIGITLDFTDTLPRETSLLLPKNMIPIAEPVSLFPLDQAEQIFGDEAFAGDPHIHTTLIATQEYDAPVLDIKLDTENFSGKEECLAFGYQTLRIETTRNKDGQIMVKRILGISDKSQTPDENLDVHVFNLNSGHKRAGYKILATIRKGNKRLGLSLDLTSWRPFEQEIVKRVRVFIFTIANYDELYGEWDQKEVIDQSFAQTYQTAYTVRDLIPFERKWSSEKIGRNQANQWLTLNQDNEKQPQGLEIQINLGRKKPALDQSQMICLRFRAKPEEDWIECKYIFQHGQLIPWRDIAPEGLSLSLENGQIKLEFKEGPLTQAMEQAFPQLTLPHCKITTHDTTLKLSTFMMEGEGSAEELQKYFEEVLPDIKAELVFSQKNSSAWQILWNIPESAENRVAFLLYVHNLLARTVNQWLLSNPKRGKLNIPFKRPEPTNEARPDTKVTKTEPAPELTTPTLKPATIREEPAVDLKTNPADDLQTEAVPAPATATASVQEGVTDKPANPTLPAFTEFKSDHHMLPALKIKGSPKNPEAIYLLKEEKEEEIDIFEITAIHDDGVEISLVVDDTIWEIRLNLTEEAPSYQRIDSDWPSQRTALERAQKQKQRKLQIQKKGTQQSLVLVNGLGESVTNARGQPVEISLKKYLGRLFVEPKNPEERQVLAAFGHGVHGDFLEITEQEPLSITARTALNKNFLPAIPGSLIPLENFQALLAQAQQTTSSQETASIAAEGNPLSEAVQRSPVFVPTVEGLTAVINTSSQKQICRLRFVNKAGDVFLLPLVKNNGTWTFETREEGIVVLLQGQTGQRNYQPVRVAVSKIDSQPALRLYSDDMSTLLFDVRLKFAADLPYLVDAQHAASNPNIGKTILEEMLLTAALVQNAVSATPYLSTQSPQLIPGLNQGGNRKYKCVLTALGKSKTYTVYYTMAGQNLLIDGEGLHVQENRVENSKPHTYTLNLFVDTRSDTIYGIAGDPRQPEKIFQIQWLLDKGPTLIPLTQRDWHQIVLNAHFSHDELLSFFRQKQKNLTRIPRPVPESRDPAAVWVDSGQPLPDHEKAPFLFSLQTQSVQPVQEPGTQLAASLKGQIFLPSPQNLEDMIYGSVQLGTKQTFYFIGNRGDILEMEMVYARYGDTTGWVLHTDSDPQSTQTRISVNGIPLPAAKYNREGGIAQVIRIGTGATELQFRFFSHGLDDGSIRCFGFREGQASTANTSDYTAARRKLEQMMRASAVREGRFKITDCAKKDFSNTWTLERKQGSRRTHIQISYELDEIKKPLRAQLVVNDQLDLKIDGTVFKFDVFALPGTNTLLLREMLDTAPNQIKARRFTLTLSETGEPLLREISYKDLDLTQAYLDEDVWPDEFLPVIKMGAHRGPLAILETKTKREWLNILSPDDNADLYKGNQGLLKFAREFFVGDLYWAAQAARLILHQDEYEKLHWNYTAVSTHRQQQDYFENNLTLASGDTISCNQVLFPLDLESHIIFEELKGYQIFFLLFRLSQRHPEYIELSSHGTPIIRKKFYDEASGRFDPILQNLLFRALQQKQQNQSSLYGHVQLDAPVSASDNRLRGEFIAAPEEEYHPEEDIFPEVNEEEFDFSADTKTIEARALTTLTAEEQQAFKLSRTVTSYHEAANQMGLGLASYYRLVRIAEKKLVQAIQLFLK